MAVTGDSVAVLTAILKMKAKASAKGLGIVARELALDVATPVYQPQVAKHTPGVAHKLADSLSRRYDPRHAGAWQIPPPLAAVPETVVPVRGPTYYRALAPPLPSRRSGSAQAAKGEDAAATHERAG